MKVINRIIEINSSNKEKNKNKYINNNKLLNSNNYTSLIYDIFHQILDELDELKSYINIYKNINKELNEKLSIMNDKYRKLNEDYQNINEENNNINKFKKDDKELKKVEKGINFIQDENQKNKELIKNKNNENSNDDIIIKYKINKDIFKLKIFGYSFVKNNINNCKIIYQEYIKINYIN